MKLVKRVFYKTKSIIERICRKLFSPITKRYIALKSKHIKINVHEVFMQQNQRRGFNRLDAVVRYLAIEQYFGKNEVGFELYKKMQANRINPEYAQKSLDVFCDLIKSWDEKGYDDSSELELDADLMLIDGSHRLALAMYFGIKDISCVIRSYSKGITYGKSWFYEKDFSDSEIKIIEEKENELLKVAREPISCILWGPVSDYFDEISELIGEKYEIDNIRDYEFPSITYERAVKAIYHIDDIENWKINEKIKHMDGEHKLRLLDVYFDYPCFRLKKTLKTLSEEGELLKRVIRGRYKNKIEDYFYDIIIHTGDNYTQSQYINSVFEKKFDLAEYIDRINRFNYVVIKEDTDYKPEDFPETYPFSKDLDIVCLRDDFESLKEETKIYFKDNISEDCEVVIKDETNANIKVRVEKGGFLIYLIDISCAIPNLQEAIISDCVHNRIAKKNYFVPRTSDELMFRVNEYYNNNAKKHHREYILKNYADLDMGRIDDVFTDNVEEVKQLVKDIKAEQ